MLNHVHATDNDNEGNLWVPRVQQQWEGWASDVGKVANNHDKDQKTCGSELSQEDPEFPASFLLLKDIFPLPPYIPRSSLIAQMVKNSPAM